MNSKKGLFKTLAMIAIIAIGLSITTSSKATPHSGRILNITTPYTYRASGYTYRVALENRSEPLNMWKIYEYNSNGTIKNANNGIYCLKMGPGFGSSSASEARTYNKYADMKNPATGVYNDKAIIDAYIATLPGANAQEKQQQYNSLVWVLEHCYVPAPSQNATDAQISLASAYRAELLKNAGIPNSRMNDDLIDIVQQIAIWYFTNDDQYKTGSILNIDAKLANTEFDSVDEVFDDINLFEEPTDYDKLYSYFINGGNANKNTAPTSTATNPVSLVSTGAKAVLNGDYYIVGPYKIEQSLDIEYNLAASLKTETGTDISYTLLDSNKNATTSTLKDLVGSNFYLKVAKTNNIEKAKFKVTSTITQNTLTYWTIDGKETEEQPVAEVVRANKSFDAEVTISLSEFDLSLRKYITKVNNTVVNTREPNIELTPLVNKTATTANYKHRKDPVAVEVGDIVIYTIRVYNEGNVSGYASEVTDYLPAQLEFVSNDSEINNAYGWQIDSTGRIAKTTKLSKANGTSNLINAFNGTTLDYKELKIKCRVKSTENLDKVITNIAEITAFTDETGSAITDRDSSAKNITLPSDSDLPNYKGKGNKADLTDSNYFYKGQEDDDDFEKLILKEFDLALRKFITKVNNVAVTTSREPVITEASYNALYNGSVTTATKTHTKTPVSVQIGDTVLYTIRIYNEGQIDGYATKVTDYLPAGLTLKANSDINDTYGWENPSGDGKTIVTSYLADKLLKAQEAGKTPDYKDLEVECVVATDYSTSAQRLKNIAEITECKDKNSNAITDRDSTPNNLTAAQKSNYNPGTSEQGWGYEDDDDYEDLVIPGQEFDLALRKFITKVNNVAVATSREPVITEASYNALYNGDVTTATKTHTKAPVAVEVGDTVLYTIRIYNEGQIDGYATKVTDYLPAGLTLKANSDINDTYGWENPSGDGKTIVTSYLSDKLLRAQEAGKTPDYKDLEVECVVSVDYAATEQSLKNIAEITECKDKNSNAITDRDSTPSNLTAAQKSNYNPGTSEQGWGYEDDDDFEELVIPKKEFDLALRKFIVKVNDEDLETVVSSNYVPNATQYYTDGQGHTIAVEDDEINDARLVYDREPIVDITPLKNKTATTANYKHKKDPVAVSVGDIVIYTIRIYNEGEISGYASSVTDYLPPQLEFVTDDTENFNAAYGWQIDSSLRKATTNILARTEIDPEDNLIKAFDGTKLDYKDLKIKCRVKSTENLDKVITNIAEITAFTDVNGKTITDRDSSAKNIVLPLDNDLPDYKGNTSNKSILSDRDYFYKGQEDDDDFEKLILQEFDLSLRKFITKIEDKEITSRIPVVDVTKLKSGASTTATYTHPKDPLEVDTADIVEYTIRVYNEGEISGYADEIKDDIPNGLEFLPTNETNKEYRWVMLDKDGNRTTDISKAVTIATDYLSKAQEQNLGDNLLEAFDKAKDTLDYKDVKVAFKVIAPSTYEGIITNKTQISKDLDEKGNEVIDRDSTPDKWIEGEDDQDVEHIKLSYFDLALRKFITGVNDKSVTSRIPVAKLNIDENKKYITYEHPKDPVEVENGNIVTYTLRVFNEGTKAGYAKQVKDDIPEGLEFLPDNDINKAYRWVMLDKDGNITTDISKAVSIATDYLSKAQENATGRNNLLLPFDYDSITEEGVVTPDSRDLKIAFKVTEPNTSDRIIINYAQISDDEDKEGKDITDIDSTPDKWIEGEDDQDIEKIKVKYFDLALRKWVTQAIVIENGKETVTETGHKAEDNPEEVVKVELKESTYSKVVVKFRYKIRITNEGEIAGYCTEISDYIPEGLKFVKADNPEWEEVEGKIVTDQLKDTLLQPGDTAEVEVLLTWINGKDNFGLKVNVAEISKDKNDSDTPDIDSVPNNKKEGEDDIDDAPVILTVKTGVENNIQIFVITAVSLAIITSGVILIKKFVL